MTARAWAATLAAIVAAAATARLGSWQLDRAAQREAAGAAIESRAAEPPLPGVVAIDRAEALHRRIAVDGQWSAAHTIYLDNRPMAGRAGFIVATPLRLADGRAIVVQRGWAPRDARERSRLPEVPTPAGAVRVEGRVAPPPSRLYELGAESSGRVRQNLDLDAFARETGLALLPVTLMQTAATPGLDDGLARDWPAPTDLGALAAKNRGYAFQWFALSALIALLYVWFQFIHPRRRRR